MLNRWIETQIKSLIRNGTDVLSTSKDGIWQLEEDSSGHKCGTQPSTLKKVVSTEVPQAFLRQDQHHGLEAGLSLRDLSSYCMPNPLGGLGVQSPSPIRAHTQVREITHTLPRIPGKFCAGGKRTEQWGQRIGPCQGGGGRGGFSEDS